MGFPSFPSSGKVASLTEVLPLMKVVVGFNYGPSDITNGEKKIYTGG